MSNNFYVRTAAFAPRTKARSENVRDELDAVQAGFDQFPTPDGGGTGFTDPVTVGTPTIDAHAATKLYVDTSPTSVIWATEWANNPEDTLVSAGAGGDQLDDYSSLHWSRKAEYYGIEWSNKAEDQLIPTDAGGDGTTHYSSLHWTAKSKLYGEEWASKPEDSLVSTAAGADGTTQYSSLHYSEKSSASAVAAAASEALAAGYAGAFNLPPMLAEDALKALAANSTSTGYEFRAIEPSAASLIKMGAL